MQVAQAAETRATASRGLVFGLVVIAVGLVAVALLGPLVSGVIDYRVTETLRNQLIELDAVSLFVVAPLGLAAAALVLRGRMLSFALALGIGAYTSYMFVQYIVGPDYGHLVGMAPLGLVLFALALVVFRPLRQPEEPARL